MQKPKLWEYKGTIRATEYGGASSPMAIFLHDAGNQLKAPVRLEAFGALAEYIKELNLTDCVEKYMTATYGYDVNLVLLRITYKDSNGRIVKVVANDEKSENGLNIFGPKDYINTANPAPLSTLELQRFCKWNLAA